MITERLQQLVNERVCLYCNEYCFKTGRLYMKTAQDFIFRGDNNTSWGFELKDVVKIVDNAIYLNYPPYCLG